MIEQRVTLRYDAQQIPAIVQAVQGDTGRDVIFELADYEIPAGATANYYIDKPDGNAVYNSAEVISNTEILAHLTEQALAVPGRNNGQVRILADDEVITSFDFVLEVEVFRGLLRMQSETEVNVFDNALQAAAEEAIQEILDQTPVVTGMQNSIAPSYSSSSTYMVGDYVMYNAQLYKCITAITTAEAWTSAHWEQIPLSDDVHDLNGLKHAINTNSYQGQFLFDFIQKMAINAGLSNDASGNIVFGNNNARVSITLPICFDKRVIFKPNSGYKVNIFITNKHTVVGENRTATIIDTKTLSNGNAAVLEPYTLFVFTALREDNGNMDISEFNQTNYSIDIIDAETELIESTIFTEKTLISNLSSLSTNEGYGTDGSGNIGTYDSSARLTTVRNPVCVSAPLLIYIKSSSYKMNVITFNKKDVIGQPQATTQIDLKQLTKGYYAVIPANTWFSVVVQKIDNTAVSRTDINDENFGFLSCDNIDTRKNVVDNPLVSKNADEVYSHKYGEISPVPSSSYAARLDPIPIKKGEMYFYHDIYAYFSSVQYNDGTSLALSEDTGINRGGYFIASDDGVALISISTTSGLHPTFFMGCDNQTYYLSCNNLECEFTKLKEAVEIATQYMGSTVYVKEGTYDLIDEFGDDIEEATAENPGIILKNKIRLIFDSRANVICNYEGDTYNVRKYFSPFNSGEYGFELIGLHLSASNVRYCIHDERGGSDDSYRNIYKGCILYLDNTDNPDGYRTVIGGGLGKDGHIEIEESVFESEETTDFELVTWHNNYAANSQSYIYIRDSFVKGSNGFRFSWLGASTLMSRMYICGCSVGKATVQRSETGDPSTAPYENTEVIEWNNVIRT